MSRTTSRRGLVPLSIAILMLAPALTAATPLGPPPSSEDQGLELVENWWESTIMDLDGDRIHDAIWIAAENNHHQYLDEDGRISVIVDFDSTPTPEDQAMIEAEVGFETQFRYWLIDSIAGTIELERLHDLDQTP
ncbi:MAG: hypothetical protein CM15mP82_4030 [Methanobacteriota archaeon]|nr:MAG: hypothetical protein CM15mP82_4030 [Euryarchaeota archaeon]